MLGLISCNTGWELKMYIEKKSSSGEIITEGQLILCFYVVENCKAGKVLI
jgi:hypothetical protein